MRSNGAGTVLSGRFMGAREKDSRVFFSLKNPQKEVAGSRNQ